MFESLGGVSSWARAGLALVFLTFCACASSKRCDRVERVLDGDTIELAGGPVIRVHGIDAPEKGQPFGDESRAVATQLLLGKTVTIEAKEQDRFGRTVASVSLADGKSFGAEMVRLGMAWVFVRYTHDPELIRLEREAKAGKVGLWQQADPSPPWDFRKSRRRKK